VAYRKPPATGPTIIEPVNTAVHSAITCGNCSCVVISGTIERRDGANMASAAPTPKAIPNRGSIWVDPDDE
jgi:hypothetical protein